MRIIGRYILRNMYISLIFGVLTVVFLFLMQFLMNNLSKFVGKGFGIEVFLQLIAYSIPWMMILAVPMGFLFAMLMGFGSMSSNQEITVIKSSGGSLFSMMRPVFILGIFLGGFLFWFNNNVLPEANLRAKILMSDMQRKKPTMIIDPGRFSDAVDGYSILARRIDTSADVLHDLTIYDHKRATHRSIITADSGTIKLTRDLAGFEIDLHRGEMHTFNLNDTSKYQAFDYENYTIYINAYGFDFNQSEVDEVRKGDREMNLSDMKERVRTAEARRDSAAERVKRELEKHIDILLTGEIRDDRQNDTAKTKIPDEARKRQSEFRESLAKKISGNDKKKKLIRETESLAKIHSNHPDKNRNRVSNRLKFLSAKISGDMNRIGQYEKTIGKYEAEIHKKYAIPAVCVVFVLVGCPLGIISRRGNFGVAAGLCLVFYVIYWAFLMTGEDLADRGTFNPALCMWFGDIVIGVLGIVLTLRVNYESFGFFLPNFIKKS